MLPSSWCIFQGRQCKFQQYNAKLHSISIRTAWHRSRRPQLLNQPAQSPDFSPETKARILSDNNGKSRNSSPQFPPCPNFFGDTLLPSKLKQAIISIKIVIFSHFKCLILLIEFGIMTFANLLILLLFAFYNSFPTFVELAVLGHLHITLPWSSQHTVLRGLPLCVWVALVA